MNPKPTAIDDFKAAVLTAAADAIVKEMTPENMHACAELVIKQALDDLTGSYGPLRTQVRQAAEVLMTQYLQEPEVRAVMAAAVREGIADATAKLAGEVRGKIEDLALKSIESAIAAASRQSSY